jgi:ribosomal protein S27AE
MTVLAEITDLLRRWDVWKRVEATPNRVDALEKRIADLEGRLQRAPGLACPKCGELEFRTEKTERMDGPLGALGATERHLKCGKCSHTEIVLDTPK